MPSNKKLLQAAAGNAGESLYAEDVFSTYLYDGNGSNRSITNGIDLAGEGGLVWAKMRSGTPSGGNNVLYDTERGAGKYLISDLASAQSATEGFVALTSFNSNGFSLGVDNASGLINYATRVYASWSFRKAEKFFDVVTYTGNGQSGQTISHSLGSVPGMILVKRTDGTSDWISYNSTGSAYKQMVLNTTAGNNSDKNFDQIATDSTLKVGHIGGTTGVGANGQTCVAYLFASDAGGFGDDGSENIIKCGSYVGTGSATVPNHVELGFEPQYWLFKNTTRAADWWCIDTMRGADYSGTARLFPNTSGAEVAAGLNVVPTATGFDLYNNNDSHNRSGDTYIYIAIRRPMKTPEAGTGVFATAQRDTTAPIFEGGFPVDAAIIADVSGAWANSPSMGSRLTGTSRLATSNANAEGADGLFMWDYMNGWGDGSGSYPEYYSFMFKRATGFMDAVAYIGNGTAGTTQAHNLGVAPEMMIVKVRNLAEPWAVYHTGLNDGVTPQNYHIRLTNGAEAADSDIWNNTAPTSSVFTTGGNDKVNANGGTYIAYLFATLAGVSKVGSYTGTGSNVNVDCGFSAGARWVMIKRSDSTGDWYVWDSVRGIVAGNDPYLLLNSSAAQVTNTDYIDPLSSGFTVTSSAPAALNASGGNYIFLAIA